MTVASAAPEMCVLLAFNASNQLAVRKTGARYGHAFVGEDEAMALARLISNFPHPTPPVEFFTCEANGPRYRVCFTQVDGQPVDGDVEFCTLEQLADRRARLAPALAAVLDQLEPHLIAIPYLHLGENDYLYKFRVERDRNRDIYQLEPHLMAIPYLHLGENDYIYKFRVERDRNRDIYQQDESARALYQSRLCEAIKTLARTNERSATAPARLDFGAVR